MVARPAPAAEIVPGVMVLVVGFGPKRWWGVDRREGILY